MQYRQEKLYARCVVVGPEIADLDEVSTVVVEKRRALGLRQLGYGQIVFFLTIRSHRTRS